MHMLTASILLLLLLLQVHLDHWVGGVGQDQAAAQP
jgi:hypothetical protein